MSEVIARLEPGPPQGRGVKAPVVEWEQADPPNWKLVDRGTGNATIRVLSARALDGRTVLLAAARPAGASGHDADAIGAIMIDPDGEQTVAEEALLSTEYDGEGRPRRIGVEITVADDPMIFRGCGGVQPDSEHGHEFWFSINGSEASAHFEVIEL